MQIEFLSDYQEKEVAEVKKLSENILDGKFSIETDRYPQSNRFFKLKEPVAEVTGFDATKSENIWAQVPFSGSLIIPIDPCEEKDFERRFFSVREIPEIIKYVKDTGRIQFVINSEPMRYKGLDYLEPIFRELNPPMSHVVPLNVLVTKPDILKYFDNFYDLASINYLDFLEEISNGNQRCIQGTLDQLPYTYVYLKAAGCTFTDLIEDLLIDNPKSAHDLLCASRDFIVDPALGLGSKIRNGAFEDYKASNLLPKELRPKPFFPIEIGKFLVNKLTYAPKGLRACNAIIDNYDEYDLKNIQASLNDAITSSNLDKITENSEGLSEILENVWNDKTITNKVKNIKIGLPVSFAVVGGVAGILMNNITGGIASGFLSNLGFKVGEKAIDKIFDQKGENLTEVLAKIRTKNYQANIYDFQKEYKGKIRKIPKN